MSDDRPTVAQRRTPEMIRDRKGFKASALTARVVPDGGLGPHEQGQLSGPDLDIFRGQCYAIDYVVFSYVTPIAWHWTEEDGTDGWHVVKQRFSQTTGQKHQSKLYLIPREGE